MMKRLVFILIVFLLILGFSSVAFAETSIISDTDTLNEVGEVVMLTATTVLKGRIQDYYFVMGYGNIDVDYFPLLFIGQHTHSHFAKGKTTIVTTFSYVYNNELEETTTIFISYFMNAKHGRSGIIGNECYAEYPITIVARIP